MPSRARIWLPILVGSTIVSGVGVEFRTDGVALWSVWSQKDAAREPESGHRVGQIVYTPLTGKLKQLNPLPSN
jgi:hypothetical protein